MDFKDFLQICRDADKLLDSLKHKPGIQGRMRRNLKPATIHYLAQKRGQKITLNNSFLQKFLGQRNHLPTVRVVIFHVI